MVRPGITILGNFVLRSPKIALIYKIHFCIEVLYVLVVPNYSKDMMGSNSKFMKAWVLAIVILNPSPILWRYLIFAPFMVSIPFHVITEKTQVKLQNIMKIWILVFPVVIPIDSFQNIHQYDQCKCRLIISNMKHSMASGARRLYQPSNRPEPSRSRNPCSQRGFVQI